MKGRSQTILKVLILNVLLIGVNACDEDSPADQNTSAGRAPIVYPDDPPASKSNRSQPTMAEPAKAEVGSERPSERPSQTPIQTVPPQTNRPPVVIPNQNPPQPRVVNPEPPQVRPAPKEEPRESGSQTPPTSVTPTETFDPTKSDNYAVDFLYLADSSRGYKHYIPHSNLSHEAKDQDFFLTPASTHRVYTVTLDRDSSLGGLMAKRTDRSFGNVENVKYHSDKILALDAHLDVLSGHFHRKWIKNSNGREQLYIWPPTPGVHVSVRVINPLYLSEPREVWDRAWGPVIYRFEADIEMKRARKNGRTMTFEEGIARAKQRWEACQDPKICDRLELTSEERSNILAVGIDGLDFLEQCWWDHDFRDIFQKYYGIPENQVLTRAHGTDVRALSQTILSFKQSHREDGYVFLSGMSAGGPRAAAVAVDVDNLFNGQRSQSNTPTIVPTSNTKQVTNSSPKRSESKVIRPGTAGATHSR